MRASVRHVTRSHERTMLTRRATTTVPKMSVTRQRMTIERDSTERACALSELQWLTARAFGQPPRLSCRTTALSRRTTSRRAVRRALRRARPLLTPHIVAETILLKDLGPQVDYRQVFFIEYFGPIVMHLVLFYGYQQYFGVEHSPVKRCAFLWARA